MCDIKRMWINQPSILQQYHKLHGLNVLAVITKSKNVRIFFLKGKKYHN